MMKLSNTRLLKIIILAIFGIFTLAWTFYRFSILNGYFNWGDETETIVTVKMIMVGQKLYSEIFNHHGPLIHLMATIAGYLGASSIEGFRILTLVGLGIVFISVYKSRVNESKRSQFLSACLFLFFISSLVPYWRGYALVYQTFVGYFSIGILMVTLLPAILGKVVNKSDYFVFGLLSSMIFSSLYPYMGVLLFFLLAMWIMNRFEGFRSYLCGFAIGFSIIILYLIVFGSISGYLAFHFYLNQFILPQFNDFNFFVFFKPFQDFVFRLSDSIVNPYAQLYLFSLSLSVLSVMIVRLKVGSRAAWAFSSVVIGILLFNFRGQGSVSLYFFHAGPTVVSLIASSVVIFINLTQGFFKKIFILVFVGFVCLLYFEGPYRDHEIRLNRIPRTSFFSDLTQKLTSTSDRIIVYPWNNIEYLLAERLPASGNIFYFPWIDQYSKNPVLNVLIDTCKDLRERQPKVIYLRTEVFWGKWPTQNYAKCLYDLINEKYFKVRDEDVYVHGDLRSEFISNGYEIE